MMKLAKYILFFFLIMVFKTTDLFACANPTVTNPNPVIGETITFNDDNQGESSWNWNFGTGANPATANTRGPHNVSYSSEGVRTVTLTITYFLGSNSSTLTINVGQTPTAGSISGDQYVCSGGDPAEITNSQSGTGSGTITYRWEYSDDPFTAWNIISGATSETYNPPSPLNATRRYRRTTVSTYYSVVRYSSPTTYVTATVETTPSAPASASSDRNNFCSDDAGNISLSLSGGSGRTVRWFTGSCGGTEVGTGSPLVIASPTATTTYYARWENACGNSACASVTVTVVPSVTASVSISASSNPVCSGTSVTFTATPTNGGATPSYQWKKNGSNTGSNNYQYTDASLVNNDQISCEMTSSLSCATPIPATSNTITMTVNPLPQGSISGNTICSGGTGLLTYSSSSGTGPFELIINGVTYSNVSSGVAFNASPNPAVTTNYTLTSITDANGCVRTGSFDDATATISVNSVVGGTISADRAFCSVVNTPPISVSGSSGSGTLSYRWESSTTDCSSGFSAISGGTLEDYDPPVLAQTTYYRRATISTLNGVACEAYSTCMTVTVYPIPTVTVTNITQAADSIYGSGGADICPELNPPDFKPENGSYDPGATYIDFRIDRVNTNGTWLFGYTTSGGTILDVKVTGDDTANPPVLDLPLEEVDCKDNDKVYMRFKIDNVVNTTINFDFLFFIVIDQQNCTNAYGNHYFQIIDPMPAVGPFN